MKKVLIVVDMINAFAAFGGSLAKSIITGKEYGLEVIEPLGKRIDAYRAAKDPIIWLCDSHDEYDREFDRFPTHAVTNTWDAQIIDVYNPKLIESSPNELVIPKKRYSGFYNTDLEYQLSRIAPPIPTDDNGVKGMKMAQVEVGGLCTSICVMDTVGGLANRDYNVVVYKDCVADFDPAAHEAALARMEALYGAKIV